MEEVLAFREQEGLSLRQLSEEFGIPVGTLSWWAHRLRGEGEPAFTEVRVSEAAPPPSSHGCALRLRLPGGVVAEFEGELANQVAGALLGDLAQWS